MQVDFSQLRIDWSQGGTIGPGGLSGRTFARDRRYGSVISGTREILYVEVQWSPSIAPGLLCAVISLASNEVGESQVRAVKALLSQVFVVVDDTQLAVVVLASDQGSSLMASIPTRQVNTHAHWVYHGLTGYPGHLSLVRTKEPSFRVYVVKRDDFDPSF